MAPDTIEDRRTGETDAQHQERMRREGREARAAARETPTERRAREARGEHPYVETTAEHDARNRAANTVEPVVVETPTEPYKMEGSYDEINRKKEALQAAFEAGWPTWRTDVLEIWPKLTAEHMVAIGNDFLKLRQKIEILYPIEPHDKEARDEFEAYWVVEPTDGTKDPEAAKAKRTKRRARTEPSPHRIPPAEPV